MSQSKHPSVRALPAHPDLLQLKRQAKELLKAFAAGEAGAVADVHAFYRGPNRETVALHDAQLVIARSYGFGSWPKLKAYVDGVTVRRLAEAVRAGDLAAVRSMLGARPELVNFCLAENDEHRVLHYAVVDRRPEMVRLLMQHGADPHLAIWPHRDATSALTLATERGYTDIVAILRSEQMSPPSASAETPGAADVAAAFERGDEEAFIAAVAAHPEFIRASDERGRTALHLATARLWPRLTAWLLDHGADATARTRRGHTPMDVIGKFAEAADGPLATRIAEMLVSRGAERTARWAILANDAAWLRARHAQGALSNEHGLLTCSVESDRMEMLRLLLDLGLDPDESTQVDGLDEVVPSWGEPLRTCGLSGKLAMAECLLQRGANPNTNVYASSSALFGAYKHDDAAMIELLERHGARLDPAAVGLLGLTDQAAALLADDEARRMTGGAASHASTVAQDLLWGAIEKEAVDIVRIALERIEWARDDGRWYGILENGLYLGPASNRPAHVEGFRLTLSRCEPNVRSRWGATLLHEVAASRGGLNADDRLTFASLLLDAGARLDVRDRVLQSTPLGWACRWGRLELVRLFLEKGADPREPDAETWATPSAWAEKLGQSDVTEALNEVMRRRQ